MSLNHPLVKFSIPVASAFLLALAALALERSPSPVPRGPMNGMLAEPAEQLPHHECQVIFGHFRDDAAETGHSCPPPEPANTESVSANAHLKTVRHVERDEEGRILHEWEELAERNTHEFVGRVAAVAARDGRDSNTCFLVDPISGLAPEEGTEISVPDDNGAVRYLIKVSRIYRSSDGTIEQLGCICAYNDSDPVVKGFEFKVSLERRVRHGFQRSFYTNGQLQMEGYFNQDLRCGQWRQFDEDGVLVWSAVYENDLLQGAWMTWHANGVMWRRGQYRENLKVGAWEEWNDEGVLVESTVWNAGQEDGLHTEWYVNGQPRCRGLMRKGRSDGRWTAWRLDGSVVIEGDFKDGDRVGEWTDNRTDDEKYPASHLMPGSDRDPDIP
jgi:antitoxin component YwqK of YwqJK toxin-antitoxin module